MDKRSQRSLLAFTYQTEDGDDFSGSLTFEAICATTVGVGCLVFVLLVCVCKQREQKGQKKDVELQEMYENVENKPMVKVKQHSGDAKTKTVSTTTANGGNAQGSGILPGQGYLALSRPTNSRELPVPPVKSHQPLNKTLSGTERPGLAEKGADANAFINLQHAHHHHGNSSNISVSTKKYKHNSNSQDYDHLGQTPFVKPSDYDSLTELKPEQGDNLKSGAGYDDDYSQVDDNTCPVVITVTAKNAPLINPSFTVQGKNNSSSDSSSQVKDEDPYNHIGDSDGTVPTSLLHRLKQSQDVDDPYEMVQDDSVQDDSAGDLQSVLGAVGGTKPDEINPPAADSWHNSHSTSQNNKNNVVEYAVVKKTKGVVKNPRGIEKNTAKEENFATSSEGPAEPPRLYIAYDNVENLSASTSSNKSNNKHKYSKVTARESLASILARESQHVYEIEPDNTYDMVEGWTGDSTGIGGASGGREVNKIGQTSETHREIGQSGRGTSLNIDKASNVEQNSSRVNHFGQDSSSDNYLNVTTKFHPSTQGYFQSNPNITSSINSARKFDSNKDANNDEEAEDCYVTLKTDSYLPTVTSNTSGNVSLLPKQQQQPVTVSVAGNRVIKAVEEDPDYEVVDDTREVVDERREVVGVNIEPDNNNMESLGNKKVGHRRQKLDHF